MPKEKIEVEKSSGNVFKDLEIPNPEEYLTKARLALIINSIIAESGFTRREAAKILDISKSQLSALSDGLLDDFSIESLFLLIRKLDCKVEIVVNGKPAHNPASRRNWYFNAFLIFSVAIKSVLWSRLTTSVKNIWQTDSRTKSQL